MEHTWKLGLKMGLERKLHKWNIRLYDRAEGVMLEGRDCYFLLVLEGEWRRTWKVL